MLRTPVSYNMANGIARVFVNTEVTFYQELSNSKESIFKGTITIPKDCNEYYKF